VTPDPESANDVPLWRLLVAALVAGALLAAGDRAKAAVAGWLGHALSWALALGASALILTWRSERARRRAAVRDALVLTVATFVVLAMMGRLGWL
jgi:hypothetical protein